MIDVYRAPLRSRRDDIDPAATLARALALGVCGFGATEQVGRVQRFAAVAVGALVWTRDADQLFWLGRIDGEYHRDASAAAVAVDLVHVRPCSWRHRPITESDTPPAVVASFGRGGRNFQRIHEPTAAAHSQRIWDQLA